MIAYNHHIKFIPELKNYKKIESSFCDIVTVQENASFNLDAKLLYELTFFNNQGRDLMLCCDREFSLTQEEQLWAFEVKDVVTFFWNSGTLNLEYIKHDNFTDELLEYWCLHIVLPIFFTIEETFDFLHAGAIEVENKSILFIAPSMGGKSTITDFFMKQGYTMISDDKVATYVSNGKVYSVPSHPHHRPYRRMEDIGYFVENYAKKPQQIQAIYKLEKSDPNSTIEIKEILGMEKFKLLRQASETNLHFQKVKRFEYLTKIANTLQVFSVTVPWNLERLNEVSQAIVEHSKKLMKYA